MKIKSIINLKHICKQHGCSMEQIEILKNAAGQEIGFSIKDSVPNTKDGVALNWVKIENGIATSHYSNSPTIG